MAQTETPARTTYTRVTIKKPGGPERLQFEELPALEPGPGEVVIDVKATGVNYADCVVRMGLYKSAKEFVGWPITPGFEVAGTVRAVGEGVSDLEVGARAMAVTRFFGYASQIKVPRHQVFQIPAGLSFEQAAGIPAVFATAWYGLVELARPRAGQTILIHSAAGGVGSSMVQLAKVHGMQVVGVVGGSHKVEAARSFGCDHVIDKSTEDLWALAERYAPQGYDMVADANGVETLQQSYDHLKNPGKLILYGFATMFPRKAGKVRWGKLISGYLRTPRFNPLTMTTSGRSVLAFNLSYLFEETTLMAEGMQAITGWLEDGSVKAPPVTTFPLADVAKAHESLQSGTTVGKLVLVP